MVLYSLLFSNSLTRKSVCSSLKPGQGGWELPVPTLSPAPLSQLVCCRKEPSCWGFCLSSASFEVPFLRKQIYIYLFYIKMPLHYKYILESRNLARRRDQTLGLLHPAVSPRCQCVVGWWDVGLCPASVPEGAWGLMCPMVFGLYSSAGILL